MANGHAAQRYRKETNKNIFWKEASGDMTTKPENMEDKIEQVLISEEALAEKVHEIGARISADYAGKRPLLVSVLFPLMVWLFGGSLPEILTAVAAGALLFLLHWDNLKKAMAGAESMKVRGFLKKRLFGK